jgi:oxygen-independent coproporphyrinogen-3 oxidase
MKKHQKLIKGKILNNAERLQLYRLASDYFLNKNYIAIGIDHYAKQNSSIVKKLKNKKLQRNFQGYTEDEAKTLIGVGSSSISSLSDGYVQNITYIPDYIESLKKNKLPILRGRKFKNKDKMYGTIIKELMCYLNVDLNEIIHKFNKENEPNIFFRELLKVKPFIDKGFVNLKNDILSIKPEARPLVRTICSSFDQYFKVNKTKYSLGI